MTGRYTMTMGTPGDPKGWMPLIAVRLPRVLDKRLRDHAAKTGENVSDVVRGAIRDRLNRQ